MAFKPFVACLLVAMVVFSEGAFVSKLTHLARVVRTLAIQPDGGSGGADGGSGNGGAGGSGGGSGGSEGAGGGGELVDAGDSDRSGAPESSESSSPSSASSDDPSQLVSQPSSSSSDSEASGDSSTDTAPDTTPEPAPADTNSGPMCKMENGKFIASVPTTDGEWECQDDTIAQAKGSTCPVAGPPSGWRGVDERKENLNKLYPGSKAKCDEMKADGCPYKMGYAFIKKQGDMIWMVRRDWHPITRLETDVPGCFKAGSTYTPLKKK